MGSLCLVPLSEMDEQGVNDLKLPQRPLIIVAADVVEQTGKLPRKRL
jgi:hypothetical protein